MRIPFTGAELITKERHRQLLDEGFTADHDDQHGSGELIDAAKCYANPRVKSNTPVPDAWPWDVEWWKPSDDHIKNLTKAGALLAAEIDRLHRFRKSRAHQKGHGP